jgi:HEAT repeat protein
MGFLKRSAALLYLVLAVGCRTPDAPESRPSGPSEPPPEAVTGPRAEAMRERNERLLRLEQALDNWWKQNQEQQYGAQEGLETHLREFVLKYYVQITDDLVTGSPRHRRAMAAALGFARRPDSVPLLLEALKDPYREVVLHALLSLYHLAKVGIPVPVDPLIPYLRHPFEDIRSNAALTIAHAARPTDNPDLLLPLINSLEDQSPAVRVHAAAAVGAMGQADAVPHLVKLLRDPVQLVRIRTLLALARIGARDSLPFMVPLLADEKEDVRKTARRVLVQLSGKDFNYDVKRWNEYFRGEPPPLPPPR